MDSHMPSRSKNTRALNEPRSPRGLAAVSIRALVIALVFWTAGEAGAQQGGFDTDNDGPQLFEPRHHQRENHSGQWNPFPAEHRLAKVNFIS